MTSAPIRGLPSQGKWTFNVFTVLSGICKSGDILFSTTMPPVICLPGEYWYPFKYFVEPDVRAMALLHGFDLYEENNNPNEKYNPAIFADPSSGN